MSTDNILKSEINVLFVDDSRNDVEILHRHLEKEGVLIGEFSIVENGDSLEKALKQSHHSWT